jgi:hypothetical protein
MPTFQDLERAFVKAHEAGDKQAASALAAEIRLQMSAPRAEVKKVEEKKPVEVMGPTEASSDLLRGFTNYLPQLQETYGGAKVLAGKVFGSEDLMKSGLATMAAAKAELATKHKASDSFTSALDKGVGTVLTDWLPYQIGSGAANLVESLGVMFAGGLAGSAIAPGVGTIAGGATGLVEKELVKRGIKELAEKVAKESGEEAAKELFERETKAAVKDIAKRYAAGTALAAQAGFHGAGETTSRAVEEAQRLGKEATDIELERVLPSAIVHGVAEYFGDKIGLGAWKNINEDAKKSMLNLSLSLLKNTAVTGTKEAPVEVIQSAAERFGAKLSLTDAAAVKEYIDSAAAAYGMSVAPAAGGTVRGYANAMAKEDARLAEMQVQQMQASQKAADEAAKISQTAVVDPQGNVAPVSFAPLQPGAVGASTAAPAADVTTTAAPAATTTAAPATTPTISNDTIEAAYASNDVSTEKTRKALEPQLVAMGLDTKEKQKEYLNAKRDELGIPAFTPGAKGTTAIKDKKAKEQWKINYETKQLLKEGEPSGGQLNEVDLARDQSGAVGTPSELGVSTGELAAPIDTRLADARRDVEPASIPAADQQPALVPGPAILNELGGSTPVTVLSTSGDRAEISIKDEMGEVLRSVPITSLQQPATLEGAPSVTQTTETVEAKEEGQEQAATPAKRVIKLEEEKAAPTETFTPDQAAYLDMKTNTRAAPATSIKEGMGYAAAETAFDFYDSAYSNINKALKDRVAQENAARDAAYNEAKARGEKVSKPEKATTLDILQKMPEAELVKLFNENVSEKKLNDTRRAEMKTRAKFIESLSKEQQEAVRKRAVEMFHREVKAVKNLGRTTTEADLRKSREQAAKEAVEKQIEEIEKPVRKVTPTKPRTGPTQIETLEQKRETTIQSALESGDVGRVFAAIANERVNDSITAFFARKLYDVLKTFDVQPTVVLGKVEDGRAGKYDPSTETITIDLDNLGKDRLDVVVLHEFTHFMADHAIDNRKNLTKEQQAAINRLDNLYRYANAQLGTKFDIGSLKEFVAEAFSNPEFQKALGNLKPMQENGKPQNVFSLFAKRIMEMLGFRNRLLSREELEEVGGTYGATLGDVLTQIEQIIKADRTAPAVGVSYMAKKPSKPAKPPIQAPAQGSTKFEDIRNAMQQYNTNPAREVMQMSKAKVGESAVRTFQNDRAAIKNWENKLRFAGRLLAYTTGFNNIYTQLTLSSGNAHYLYTQYVQEHSDEIRKLIAEYAEKRGVDINTAVNDVGLFAIALHEPERRKTLYLRTVPLKTDEKDRILVNAKGVRVTPEEARQEILSYLDKHELDETGAKYLRDQLEKIVSDKKNLSTKKEHASALDINDRAYSVAGYEQDQIDSIMKEYNLNKVDVDPILKQVKELNKAVIDLNEKANYMSKYAKNYIMFYGYENYVPFKGKHFNEDKADIFNVDNRKLGGELQDQIHTFEGRVTVPDNPILQVMADGAQAAMRAGRKDVTQAIYNAVNDKTLQGSVMKFKDKDGKEKDYISFEDRANEDILTQLKGETKVFHYMPDGRVAIIQIDNKDQREAIRRTYKETNPLWDTIVSAGNLLTGTLGQLHTRYNIAFAPVNFVRDVLTNAFTLGAEKGGLLGPLEAFRYIGAVASNIVTSKGMLKTSNFARLYSQGKISTIDALAAKDDYYRDLRDYVKTGGKVSYIAGIAPKGQYQEFFKGVGGNYFLNKKEQVDKYFDMWIDTFELSARVASFQLTKANEIARLTKKDPTKSKDEIEKAAITTASAYAKNLANFEQVGQWGRTLGAFFMFFRPSATGAVRAIDAIAPALNMNVERAVISTPEYARAANIREELSKGVDATKEKKLKAELAEMDKAVATFRENYSKAKTSATVMSLALIGMGMAAYAMSLMMADDDELGRNKTATDDMSRWTRFARFPVPGTDIIVQIPWGFGLGGFAAMGAQMASIFNGRTRAGDTVANMFVIGMDSFLPLPVSRMNPIEKPLPFLIDSMMPSAARPLVEYAMNVDALGRKIYNDRTSRLGDAYTGGDNIPELYKDAAIWWLKTTGYDVSPNSLYFFANNYADGVTRLVQNANNVRLWLADKKDFNPKTDTMIFDSFFGTKANFDAREWSRVEADLEERSKYIKMLKDNHPEDYAIYMSKHPMDQMLAKMYNHDVNGRLKDLREQANKWRAMEGLDPRTRTALVKNIVFQQNFEKRRLIEIYKAYGIKP